MATVPSTIIVDSIDKVNFPVKMMNVVMKHLFRYGVKDISINGDKIFIKLSYSPKDETLSKKFGNLPVKYIRTQIENKEEFDLLTKAIKKYVFNVGIEEEANKAIEEPATLPALPEEASTMENINMEEDPSKEFMSYILSDDGYEKKNEDNPFTTLRIKRRKN